MFVFTAESQRTLRKMFLFVGRYRQTKSSYPGWKDFLPKAGGLWRIGISRFSIKNILLGDLCVSNESCSCRTNGR